MNLISSADINWGIGKNNELLFRVREDMAYFKEKTIGKVVVMGHNTFLSLPGQRPLAERTNIVLSTKENFHVDGVIVCKNEVELFKELEKYDTEDIFIIGGASVYEQFLGFCDFAYITQFHSDGNAEKFLPRIDKDNNWKLISQSEEHECNGIKFTFNIYKKIGHFKG